MHYYNSGLIKLIEVLMAKGIKRGGLARGERLQIMLSGAELELVDDFRFRERMPSRAAAVRELFRRGLAAVEAHMPSGRKSSDFGVRARPDGNGRVNK